MPFFDWLGGSGYMPEQANRICAKGGCPNVVPSNRRLCDLHRKALRKRIDRGRGPGSKRGAGRLRAGLAGWVARRADYLCEVCGRPGAEVDHKVPTAEGGTDNSENLQFICPTCHGSKTARENARRTAQPRASVKGGEGGAGL